VPRPGAEPVTWTIKVRGAPSTYEAAEYECPAHGRFAATVPRPAPDNYPCAECGHASAWRFPTPHGRVKLGEVAQGKVMEYPPESVCLDTRPLADGMPLAEWKAKQRNITRDIGLKRARDGRR